MILRKYTTCRICGVVGGIFITRKSKLASGEVKIYPDNVCCLCANELSRDRYYKRRKDPSLVLKDRQRLRDYKRNNKAKIKEQARIYWLKYREEIQKRRNLKKSLKEKEINQFKKHSHHRIPSQKHPLRGFDFRSIKTMREA